MTPRSPKSPLALTRRDLLRAGAMALVAGGTIAGTAACGPGYAAEPDVLVPLLRAAEADARDAGAITDDLASQVATVRSAHADALRAEIDRQNRPKDENQPQQEAPATDLAALKTRLETARTRAADLVPAAEPHRAGLLAGVAAGCASAQQLAPALGQGTAPEMTQPKTGELPPEAIEAVQQALATEHAAVWTYGLVSAFLPADFQKGMDDAAADHRDRRDAAERLLTAVGATPKPAEAAYIPPEPVTDQTSAVRLVAEAESDAAKAWHGIIPRTEDRELRTMALTGLIGSTARATRWRAEAGVQPAVTPLPGS